MNAASDSTVFVDSGLTWLGAVPAHWTVEPLRNITTFTTGWTPPTSDDTSYEGDNLWANISDLREKTISTTAKALSTAAVQASRIPQSPVGSLLFSFKLSVGQVAITKCAMYTNEAIATFRESSRLAVAYAYYSFPVALVQNANENIYGAKLLNAQLIRSARIPTPPLDEQRQIAEYLDRETGQIDVLIFKQEQLVDTLTERRQAVIAQAVTRGLDPKTELKHSGTAWLGEIPAHWLTPKVGLHFSVTLGKMLDAKRASQIDDVLLPYVRAGNIQEDELRLEDLYEMAFSPTEVRVLSLRVGDLLVVEGGAVGVNQLLEEDLPGVSFQKTVNRVRARDQSSTAYLGFVLDVLRHRGVLDMLCNKSTIAHFTADKLQRIVYPQPPVDEQNAIVVHLRNETRNIDALIAKARQVVEVLQERRQALISAAVTGKIDVRGL